MYPVNNRLTDVQANLAKLAHPFLSKGLPPLFRYVFSFVQHLLSNLSGFMQCP